jgi:hypothetical protein
MVGTILAPLADHIFNGINDICAEKWTSTRTYAMKMQRRDCVMRKLDNPVSLPKI